MLNILKVLKIGMEGFDMRKISKEQEEYHIGHIFQCIRHSDIIIMPVRLAHLNENIYDVLVLKDVRKLLYPGIITGYVNLEVYSRID